MLTNPIDEHLAQEVLAAWRRIPTNIKAIRLAMVALVSGQLLHVHWRSSQNDQQDNRVTVPQGSVANQ